MNKSKDIYDSITLLSSYHYQFYPSRLGLYNTPTTSLKRVKTPFSNECPGYDIKPFDGEARNLGNVEYPFIAIASTSSLVQSGCTW